MAINLLPKSHHQDKRYRLLRERLQLLNSLGAGLVLMGMLLLLFLYLFNFNQLNRLKTRQQLKLSEINALAERVLSYNLIIDRMAKINDLQSKGIKQPKVQVVLDELTQAGLWPLVSEFKLSNSFLQAKISNLSAAQVKALGLEPSFLKYQNGFFEADFEQNIK